MRTRPFGRTGLKISALGYGAMPLSLDGRPGEDEALAILDEVLDMGVTLFDTADVYRFESESENHNERLLARAIGLRGTLENDIIVATKGGMMRNEGRWEIEGSPKMIELAIRKSHRALGGKRPIPLWQHHWPDPRHSITEMLEPVRRAVDEGLIRFVGVGNYSVEQIKEAMAIVDIVSVQSQHNIWNRDAETDGVLAFCESNDLVFFPWRPMGGMGLSGRLHEISVLSEIAARHGASPHATVLAWQMAMFPCIVPIPGSKQPSHIRDCLTAAQINLSPEDVGRLCAISEDELPKRNRPPSWGKTPPLSRRD